VCAVSYLNTVPLVWGMQHGPQREAFDVSFALPSVCADQIEAGAADIGLVPVIEMQRQGLHPFRSVGIACDGPVRSILLISRVEPGRIQSIATDAGSRTSVMLNRVILGERYGAAPREISMPANLERMLSAADAALIIGDPALRLEPSSMPYHVLDLGHEWKLMTGLPMVFALWAGRRRDWPDEVGEGFIGSLAWGERHADDMIQSAAAERSLPVALVRRYLTHHIQFRLGAAHLEGLQCYLELAGKYETVAA
jgi:chorismate dehydratase